MRHSFLFALGLASLPIAALAQDWATTDVCTVLSAEVTESALAPATLEDLEVKAAAIPNGTGRFWRAESPAGAVSYLWGTFHSADPLILDLPEDLHTAITNARVVAVEIDYVAKSRDELREGPFYAARFKEAGDPFLAPVLGNTIAGLSPEISDWVRERAIELGWTEDLDLILSPAGIAEMLLSDPCEDFANGVLPIQDDYIQLLGRLAGARILSLEAPLEFLDDLTMPENEATAEAIIQVYAAYLKPVTSNAERATAFALYRQGRLGLGDAWDAAYLNDVLQDQGAQALALTDAYLLTLRNRRFLKRARTDLDAGGVVMAVGAGHLPGKTGLVSMLREAGFAVTRVVVPGEVE